MDRIEELKGSIEVCMFDQYGTVVDMQSGLTAVATPFLRSKGWYGNPNSFVTWWRRTHFEDSMIDALLHKEHTPYREIGHRAVAQVLARAGIDFTMDEVRYLVGEIEKLLDTPGLDHVTVFDNLSSGNRDFLPQGKPGLTVAQGDISRLEALTAAMQGHDIVFHFAEQIDPAGEKATLRSRQLDRSVD